MNSALGLESIRVLLESGGRFGFDETNDLEDTESMAVAPSNEPPRTRDRTYQLAYANDTEPPPEGEAGGNVGPMDETAQDAYERDVV